MATRTWDRMGGYGVVRQKALQALGSERVCRSMSPEQETRFLDDEFLLEKLRRSGAGPRELLAFADRRARPLVKTGRLRAWHLARSLGEDLFQAETD